MQFKAKVTRVHTGSSSQFPLIFLPLSFRMSSSPPMPRKPSSLQRRMSRKGSQKQQQQHHHHRKGSEFRVSDVVTVDEPDTYPPTHFSSPSLSPLETKKPIVIQPPVLRPQHVYAPVAPLGMLSLGVLSKHKSEGQGGLRGDAEKGGTAREFKKILSCKYTVHTYIILVM